MLIVWLKIIINNYLFEDNDRQTIKSTIINNNYLFGVINNCSVEDN